MTRSTAHNPAWTLDLGTIAYQEAYLLQKRISDAKISGNLDRDVILVLEHPPVFTLGKRGGAENLRVTDRFLAEKAISVVPTERGGNITYHGPGQIVVYPIVDIGRAGIGVADFVTALEEAMITTCRSVGVTALRNPANHGIWVENNKIGSIGLAVSRGVCRHGLALNVTLDLTPFTWINPCGLAGVGMTSIAADLEKKDAPLPADLLARVREHLIQELGRITGFTLEPLSHNHLLNVLEL